ncbi:Protein C37H5.13 a [Aphelenchoides avenae]|nr:Protein C37H5.13 a [Aphelenchus avenae]
MPKVPQPESVKDLYDVCRDHLGATDISKVGHMSIHRRLMDEEAAVFEVRPVEEEMLLMLRPWASAFKSVHNWMKCVTHLGDNQVIHRAMLAFLADTFLAPTIGCSHGSHGAIPELVASLDQSIWFHDYDFSANEWLLYETFAPVANSGRGLAHGRFWTTDGRLVASTAQEALMRYRTGNSGPHKL